MEISHVSKPYVLFKDTVHGSVELPSLLIPVINHPLFQRLADLKQLGVANHLYRTANHTRFEHSIGVGYLAMGYVNSLIKHDPSLKQDLGEYDGHLITIAGLCHDLGHGPFSHLFEKWRKNTKSPFHHEDYSILGVERIADEIEFDPDVKFELDKSSIHTIQTLISGFKKNKNEASWKYQIVANHDTELDVDKFDYLRRDSGACGVSVAFEGDRIIQNSRVIDGSIAYNIKDEDNVWNIFHSRYDMHKRVYQHPTVSAVQWMFFDMFTESESECKWTEADVFSLSDTVIEDFKRSKVPKVKGLYNRLYSRQLYKAVCDGIVPPFYNTVHLYELESNPSSIFGNRSVIIDIVTLDHGSGLFDPMFSFQFYSSKSPKEIFRPATTGQGLFMQFQQKVVRVIVRDANDRDAVFEIASTFFKKHGIKTVRC